MARSGASWAFRIPRFRRPASRSLSPLPPLQKLEKRKGGEPRVLSRSGRAEPGQGVPDPNPPG
jgi:hypothetical protein